MKVVHAVIGAAYGDEGKGLITDYLARNVKNPLVVRFNGGSQAGHTVTTPTGLRHVFSHFGSGSFVNAPTYLDRNFIVNPLTFRKELSVLAKMDVKPGVYINGECNVTTPWDMLNNQIFDHHLIESNPDARHGSCGVGIFETWQRSHSHRLSVNDLMVQDGNMARLLRNVRDNYCMPRLLELVPMSHLEKSPLWKLYQSEEVLNDFITAFKVILKTANIENSVDFMGIYSPIYEGAQGLLLSKDNKADFPHLTPSKTGIAYTIPSISEVFGEDVAYRVYYVTRAYTTRHGNGPLPHEMDLKGYNIEDKTNVHNLYQGSLRFAPLDLDRYDAVTDADIKQSPFETEKVSVVTCLDQIGNIGYKVKDGQVVTMDGYDYRDSLIDAFDVTADGPTYQNVLDFSLSAGAKPS